MNLHRLLSAGLTLTTILAISGPVRAGEAAAAPQEPAGYTVLVGLEQQQLDLTALPRQPYWDGDVLMVPLARISQSLGYQVSWDPETGDISVDDGYIQKAVLHHGTAEALFTGHLKVIDLSREVDNAAPTNVIDGCTYVPLSFFLEFLNDASLNGSTISIAPSMAELNSAPILSD